jgi:hypothetical protein
MSDIMADIMADSAAMVHQSTLTRHLAASPLVPTSVPIVDQDIPLRRACRTASRMCRSAAGRPLRRDRGRGRRGDEGHRGHHTDQNSIYRTNLSE